MPLHRLVYCSRARPAAVAEMDATLAAILEVSRRRNKAVEVTGALLACGGWFLQALEGSKTAVTETYERIWEDPRHDEHKVIDEAAVSERLFSEWNMCGLHLSPTDQQIVKTLESSGSYDPTRLLAPAAIKLLVTIRQIQSKPR